VALALPAPFFLIHRAYARVLQKTSNALLRELKALFGTAVTPGTELVFVRVFLLVGATNLLGLLPYVFTRTRHLSVTLALALPLWVGYVILASARNPEVVLAHLVPLGTPSALMGFIVLIELVRNLIRPLTLAVRLAANIIAGHLLLSLVSIPGAQGSVLVLRGVLAGAVALSVLETGVSLVQGYVFSVLSALYAQES
jgi:F-type H+-transporting ATPase subunit a